VTVECALATQPNVALVGEEVQARGQTLAGIAGDLASLVRRRAAAGMHHGLLLLPEGLIEFVPEMRALIAELNRLLAGRVAELAALPSDERRRSYVLDALSPSGRALFAALPERIAHQLLIDRDAHGNVQVSQIDTEVLLELLVRERLATDGFSGTFQVQGHFFGYEGRSGQPSNFDADYTYALGRLAALLVAAGRTGSLCALAGLAGPAERWRALAVPLTSMMRVEQRKGRAVPVIGKALVRLDAEPFRTFAAAREAWAADDAYVFPGPIQFFGPGAIADARTHTLALEHPAR
jgi:pyrophosphate--fructose-6-phosphate 1-phosphotransferase